MKIDLTKEEIELVITGLAHAQSGIRKTLDNMTSLEAKMMQILRDDCDDNEDSHETEDVSGEPKPKESFFYDTFNFEVEQERFEGSIISDTMHLRFINGKQGQLGIEYGYRCEGKYKPLFIAREDKLFFKALFQSIMNASRTVGVKFLNAISDIYDLAGRKYAIQIESSAIDMNTVISLKSEYEDIKYKIEIPDAMAPTYLKIYKVDGSVAAFESPLQLSILIDFIDYHL